MLEFVLPLLIVAGPTTPTSEKAEQAEAAPNRPAYLERLPESVEASAAIRDTQVQKAKDDFRFLKRNETNPRIALTELFRRNERTCQKLEKYVLNPSETDREECSAYYTGLRQKLESMEEADIEIHFLTLLKTAEVVSEGKGFESLGDAIIRQTKDANNAAVPGSHMEDHHTAQSMMRMMQDPEYKKAMDGGDFKSMMILMRKYGIQPLGADSSKATNTF